MVLLGFNLLCKFIGEVESYGRTAAGVAHKSDSDGNEWQGEQLAHVECHPYFECFLWVFDEFDKEAACKQGYEKHSEQEPRAFFGVAFPVHPHQQGEQCEVATGFVELCRVRWGCEYGLCTCEPLVHVDNEAESPGQVGGMAIDFVVEQVADAYQRSDKGYGDYEAVECP